MRITFNGCSNILIWLSRISFVFHKYTFILGSVALPQGIDCIKKEEKNEQTERYYGMSMLNIVKPFISQILGKLIPNQIC